MTWARQARRVIQESSAQEDFPVTPVLSVQAALMVRRGFRVYRVRKGHRAFPVLRVFKVQSVRRDQTEAGLLAIKARPVLKATPVQLVPLVQLVLKEYRGFSVRLDPRVRQAQSQPSPVHRDHKVQPGARVIPAQ